MRDTQSWLPMLEMKSKVPQRPAPKTLLSAQESVDESAQE